MQSTHRKQGSDAPAADQVEIIVYTDPLCCWSWGMEPQLQKLQVEYGDNISWRYRMGGLLPGWYQFNDEINAVSRPLQMGPVWMQASETTGMPINTLIWKNDPPASSYPACIAVKSFSLQSVAAATKYLRLLREALFLDGRNIAREETLTEIAEELYHNQPALFDIEKFTADRLNGNALQAFREDMQEVQIRKITRFPSFIIKCQGKAVMLTGYRPYELLVEAIEQVMPSFKQKRQPADKKLLQHLCKTLTERECRELKKNMENLQDVGT